MNAFLLDTNVLSAYSNGRPAVVSMVTSMSSGRALATSVLCYGEVIEHLMGQRDSTSRIAEFRQLMSIIKPIYPSFEIMERYASIRREMRQLKNGLIGDFDTLIAATSIRS